MDAEPVGVDIWTLADHIQGVEQIERVLSAPVDGDGVGELRADRSMNRAD